MTSHATDLWTSWTRDRDARSFETLVCPELPHALGFARRLGCSAADAEDAVQEALARLVSVRDDVPAAVGVRAWLCREVHVRARSRLRTERRRKARETAAALPPVREQGEPSVAARDEVERALAGLGEDERTAVELRYLHDLDYREMAVVLRTSDGACRQRVHKALTRLRARLGGDAAAMLAALPLPAAGDAAGIVKAAIAKASAGSAATGGGVAVMATTAQKVTIAVVAAAAIGVAGTLTVEHALAPEASSAASSAAATQPADARTTSRGAPRAAPADVATLTAETEALRSRVVDLESRLAAATERAADLDAMDPMAVLVYSRRPLAWKAQRLLDIADDKARWAAVGKVATVLNEKETSGREFLEALRTETDPKVIGMIGLLVGGALEKTPREDRRAFVEIMRSAPLPETRAAAVNAVFMTEQFRGGFDEETKAFAKEMNASTIEALRTETSPDVIGAIAFRFDAWGAPPEVMDVLKDVAARLPPSPGRRRVWEAMARGTIHGGGPDFFQLFQAATVQDVKDDIAAGIARGANSGMAAVPAPATARERFRVLFTGTSDVAVRRSLLRGALYGLGCVDWQSAQADKGADAARFFREVAALEPDAKHRARIEKIAALYDEKGAGAFAEVDRIIYAKE